jgi:peptide/nickel transport system permease protein
MSPAVTTPAGLRRERLGRLAQHAGVRLLGGILVLWVTVTLAFFALKLMPGDPALAILGEGNPTPEAITAFRHEYGLDRPLAAQYAIYLGHVLQGELGVSYSQHLPVIRVLAEHTGATLELCLSSLGFAWLMVLVWTLLTAGRRGGLGGVGSALETVAASLPPFWLAILLLSVFAFALRLVPPAGNEGWRALILPSIALATPLAGFIGQVTRESLEIVLEQPFVLSARARGLSDWAVRYRHGLRHSVLPGISLSGWALGSLISGAVVVEIIFSRQGLGSQLVQAVELHDLPLVIGITLVVAVAYVLANVLVDVLYQLVDPRLLRGAP